MFLTTVIGIVACALIGWGFWSVAASQYRRAIDTRMEEAKTNGMQISFDDRQVFGFPRHMIMRFTNVRSLSGDGITFHADQMEITAAPWNWLDFDIAFKHPVAIVAPLDADGHALTLSSVKGEGHLMLDSEGFWRQGDLSLEDSQIGLTPSYIFKAGHLNATLSRPLQPPKDHNEVGLTLEGEADHIILPEAMPSPFGDKADKLAMHMRVMGPMPDLRTRASVEGWNKASGIVEFDHFSVNWGALDITAKGTLGFDDDLQPEGAFVSSIKEPAKVFQALIDKSFIAMHDQGMLNAAMTLFAKPSGNNEGTELPITIQLGGLFMGPVRVFAFPSIAWPQEPPPVH